MLKRLLFAAKRSLLGSLIVLAIQIPQTQIAQAHTSNQILSKPETEQELKDLFQRGQQLTEAHKFPEALILYQHATSLDRENPRIFSAIGYLQAVQGNFQEAAYAFQQAVILDSKNANFYYALAYNRPLAQLIKG